MSETVAAVPAEPGEYEIIVRLKREKGEDR